MPSKLLLPGFILIFFVVLLVKGSLELSIDAMLFPWVTGVFGSILLLWEIRKEIRESREGTSKKIGPDKSSGRFKNYLSGFAWVTAIFPLIYLLGFIMAIPLFLFLYLKSQGERWMLCLSVALLGEIIFYLAFVVMLRVHFYEGLLFSYIMG